MGLLTRYFTFIFLSLNQLQGSTGSKSINFSFIEIEKTLDSNLTKPNFYHQKIKLVFQNPWENPIDSIVENLHGTISPFGISSCLVVFDNLHGINIPSFEYPLILRRPYPIFQWYHFYGTWQLRLVWIPKGIQPIINIKNKTMSSMIFNKFSKFLGDTVSSSRNSYFVEIHFQKFVVSTKPWRCQVEVFAYPRIMTDFPKIFSRGFFTHGKVHLFLTVLNVNILIHREHNNSQGNPEEWMTSKAETGHPNEVYLAAETKPLLNINSFFNQVKRLITKVNILKVVNNVFTSTMSDGGRTIRLTFSAREIPIAVSELRCLPCIQKQSSLKPNELSIWSLRLDRMQNPAADALRQIMLCKIQSNPTKTFDNTAKKFVHVQGSIWQLIMGNYTFQHNSLHWICLNGKIVKVPVYPTFLAFKIELSAVLNPKRKKENIILPLEVNENLNFIRFVSCGRREKDGFAFDELIGVFDFWIWALILINIGVNSTFFHFFSIDSNGRGSRSVSNFVTVCFGSVNAFLEQGNPLPDIVYRNVKLKLTIISFLLTAGLLSNAYKNSNVYNMVMPRKSKPYEKFDELLQDHFTIHTRTSSILFSYPGANFQSADAHHPIIKIRDTQVMIRSEIGNFLIWAGFPPEMKAIARKSSLNPSMVKSTNSLLFEGIKKFEINKSASTESELKEIYFNEEKRQLNLFMETCSNSALLLPAYKCIEYQKHLIASAQSHVYVGKESYLNVSSGYKVGRFQPEFVSSRIKGVIMSGILEWWDNLLQASPPANFKTINEPPVKPTMQGNVSLIFIILAVGVLVSLIILLVECLYQQLGVLNEITKHFHLNLFNKNTKVETVM